uniref:XcmI n=1 Tax=Xanthomonas campestris TaxID=339 RepID=G3JXC4_XANCA|nr:XcmI [Xanthomonas campestris]
MPVTPPQDLIDFIDDILSDLLTNNPLATSSEAYVQNHIEFELVRRNHNPKYYLRIGINYHGEKVQHIMVDPLTGKLIGWNPAGDALGTGANAKMLLANYTIFDRAPGEHMMTDCKVGGGPLAAGQYVRAEFKVRGWLGKTKNLDGKQFQKDLDLMGADKADLLVWCLSETAHCKFRGEGPAHQAGRRTGCQDFAPILLPTNQIGIAPVTRQVPYRRIETANLPAAQALWINTQNWVVRSRKVTAAPGSLMPGAEHYVTMCWRV